MRQDMRRETSWEVVLVEQDIDRKSDYLDYHAPGVEGTGRALKSSGYGVTLIDAEGSTGAVKVISTIVERSAIKRVVEMIRENDPLAFYSIEDVRMVSEAVTPFRAPVAHRWTRFVSLMRSRER